VFFIVVVVCMAVVFVIDGGLMCGECFVTGCCMCWWVGSFESKLPCVLPREHLTWGKDKTHNFYMALVQTKLSSESKLMFPRKQNGFKDKCFSPNCLIKDKLNVKSSNCILSIRGKIINARKDSMYNMSIFTLTSKNNTILCVHAGEMMSKVNKEVVVFGKMKSDFKLSKVNSFSSCLYAFHFFEI
jgi:hypothetical protein